MAALALLVLLGLLAWSSATTSYAFFRDEVLVRLMTRHAASERTAQAEIAQLKGELEKLRVKSLSERAEFGNTLETLLRRQTALEQRHGALARMNREAAQSGAPGKAAPARARRRPAPGDSVQLDTPAAAPRESRALPAGSSRPPVTAGLPHAARVAGLIRTYDTIEAEQTAALTSLEERLERDSSRFGRAYLALGLKPPAAPRQASATGGPFVPVPAGGFERALLRLAEKERQVSRLKAGLDQLPIRHPAPGTDESSGFGVRHDPFVRTLALHSGIDFRAETGTAVHAAGNGVVTEAGWMGGYGKMVEIDHGNGLSSRYGHLSSIGVSVGDVVKVGAVVGRVGTTGRSTGPHLHFETRIDGEAVNPARFLAVGAKLDDDHAEPVRPR